MLTFQSRLKSAVLANTFTAKHCYRALNQIRAHAAIRRNTSFGQCAEDVWLLQALRAGKVPWANSGFFVDIGANHPVVFSATYLLYKAGWNGLTVEPIPSLCALHRKFRPRDICLNMGVAAVREKRRFWETAPDLFSSFSKAEAQNAKDNGLCTILREGDIWVDTPSSILRHVPHGTRVNYLTIDTEGLDAEILGRWPWDLSRPDVISCEALAQGDRRLEAETILAREGYAPIKLFPICGFWGSHELAAKVTE